MVTICLGGGGSSAPAATKAEPAKTEAKKEEAKPAAKEEPEADVGLGGGLFGDDEEW